MGREGARWGELLGAYAITKLSSSSKSLARTAWRTLLGRWMGAMYAMVQLCGLGNKYSEGGKKCYAAMGMIQSGDVGDSMAV